MKKYIKIHITEYILCILISLGFSFNVFAGFDMKDPWSSNPTAVSCSVILILMILFVSYYNRLTRKISIATSIVMLSAVMIMLRSAGAFTGAEVIDGSTLLTWIILMLDSIAVFWMARTRIGIVIMLLTGALMTAAFDLLKFPVSAGGYFVFVFGAFTLFLYRACDSSGLHADTDKRPDLKGYLMQSVTISIILILLSGGAYFAVVQSMLPHTNEKEIAKKLTSIQLLEDLGISSKKVVYLDKPDQKIHDQQQEKRLEAIKKNETEKNQHSLENQGTLGQGEKLITAISVIFRKNVDRLWLTIPVLILILISAVMTKLLLRKKWYKALLNKSNEECAIELYLFFIKKMQKAGFKRPDNLTLLEYAANSESRMERFAAYDANFLKLTQIYTAILYGCQKITDKECELFHDFYKDFSKNLRKEMGSAKYCVRFFLSFEL